MDDDAHAGCHAGIRVLKRAHARELDAALAYVAELEKVAAAAHSLYWCTKNSAASDVFAAAARVGAALDAVPAAETTSGGEARRPARFSDVVGAEQAAEYHREDCAAEGAARQLKRRPRR